MSEKSGSPGVRRREFLKVLGATGAATAAVGCGTGKVEKLIPYLVHPNETVPGVSAYYATTCRECSAACGVIAETRDGRVIKLEGNPVHPLNRGALCARGQAALQGLYNPDRYRTPMIRRNGRLAPATWDEALQLFSQKLGEVRSAGRAGGAVFINQHESGSFPFFLDAWLADFGMPRHLSYDSLADTAAMEANRQSYGVAWPTFDFSAANLIVSFGADFLDGWGASVTHQLDFAEARAKLQSAPRLIYVGPRRSLTGLNADEWIACRPGSELGIVEALRGNRSVEQAAEQSDVPAEQVQRLRDAVASARPSLILASGTTANGAELALAVNALNQASGNVGVTVKPSLPVSAFGGAVRASDIYSVAERLRGGQISLLMVRGANPVFTLPVAIKFGEAMSAAAQTFKVSFSKYPDETAELCDLILPDNHALESWGDAQPIPGTISMQQPAMDSVFQTRQTADVLIQAAKGNQAIAARYTAPNFREWLIARYPGGTTGFTSALSAGVGQGELPALTALPATPGRLPAIAPRLGAQQGDFFLVTYPSPALGDGRGANKPWLQELPDPVSKICWQTWVEIHPETAKRLDIEAGEIVRVETPGGAVSAPAYLYPGIRRDTVAIPMGQGHKSYGRFAQGVGVNVREASVAVFDPASGALEQVFKASVTRTADYVPLVTTEGSARQHGRGIARAVAATELRGSRATAGREAEPDSGQVQPGQAAETEHGGEHVFPGDASHEFLPGLRSPTAADAQGSIASGLDEKEKDMYDPGHWSGMANRRWAMTIDLARCTGCSACVTACYAENNIPTVGAAYQARNTAGTRGMPGGNIIRGREMAWIRLERYYEGGEDGGTDFDVGIVPMLCQHCGNAPCEPVCPVYATYHSPDGLNVQVYNRCVGTRYCSNNCPYKVRYFNWFGYGETDRPQYAWPEPLNWQLNPDVTVRSKGVMEKCTFCVQRIREAEHRATAEGRSLEPDEFTVACAQACPSRAITFGDAADPAWSVTSLAADERAYHVFEELNTFTAVVYLKKVSHRSQTSSPAGAAH
ncbi:MAG: molybdopterin-dependent oxidoreductase [Gemmatimonadaceae bacterium]